MKGVVIFLVLVFLTVACSAEDECLDGCFNSFLRCNSNCRNFQCTRHCQGVRRMCEIRCRGPPSTTEENTLKILKQLMNEMFEEKKGSGKCCSCTRPSEFADVGAPCCGGKC
eukprot:gene619-8123_t